MWRNNYTALYFRCHSVSFLLMLVDKLQRYFRLWERKVSLSDPAATFQQAAKEAGTYQSSGLTLASDFFSTFVIVQEGQS